MGLMSWIRGGSKEPDVAPVELTTDNFENELANESLPALVDFWSPTCGPCKKLVPVMTTLAKRYDGRVRVYHVNAADSPEVASYFKVSGTPTVVVMKKGVELGRVVGYRPASWFEQMIETEFPS